MSKDNGGSAFPLEYEIDVKYGGTGHSAPTRKEKRRNGGMSWLDYAAIKMAAAWESDRSKRRVEDTERDVSFEVGIARAAYRMAEALLAEKRRRESEGE